MPQKFKYFSKFIDEIINEIQSCKNYKSTKSLISPFLFTINLYSFFLLCNIRYNNHVLRTVYSFF